MPASAQIMANGSSSPLSQDDFTPVNLANFDDTNINSWSWTVTDAPEGSACISNPASGFSAPTSATTTFTPDVEGTYVIRLDVTDIFASSGSDTLEVGFTFTHLRQDNPVGWHRSVTGKIRSPKTGETTEYDGTRGWKNNVHRLMLVVDKIVGLQRYCTVKVDAAFAGTGGETLWQVVGVDTLPNGDMIPTVLPAGENPDAITGTESDIGSLLWNETGGLAAGDVVTMLVEGLTANGYSGFGYGAALPGIPVYASGSGVTIDPAVWNSVARRIGHVAARADGTNYIYFRPSTSREWNQRDFGPSSNPGEVDAANLVTSLAHGSTLQFKIDGGSTHTMTFTGTSGNATSDASAPAFPISGTLSVMINGMNYNINVVAAADHDDVATQVQSYLTTNTIAATCTHLGGGIIRIASTKQGYSAQVFASSTDIGIDLGFPGTQTWATGNISDLSNITITDYRYAFCYEGYGELLQATDNGTGKLRLQTQKVGSDIYSIQIIGGTANASFGFDTTVHNASGGGGGGGDAAVFTAQMATGATVTTGSYVTKGKTMFDASWFTFGRAELRVWAEADAGTMKVRLWNETDASWASGEITVTGDGTVKLESDGTDGGTLVLGSGTCEYHLRAYIDGGATLGTLWNVNISFEPN